MFQYTQRDCSCAAMQPFIVSDVSYFKFKTLFLTAPVVYPPRITLAYLGVCDLESVQKIAKKLPWHILEMHFERRKHM